MARGNVKLMEIKIAPCLWWACGGENSTNDLLQSFGCSEQRFGEDKNTCFKKAKCQVSSSWLMQHYFYLKRGLRRAALVVFQPQIVGFVRQCFCVHVCVFHIVVDQLFLCFCLLCPLPPPPTIDFSSLMYDQVERSVWLVHPCLVCSGLSRPQGKSFNPSTPSLMWTLTLASCLSGYEMISEWRRFQIVCLKLQSWTFT